MFQYLNISGICALRFLMLLAEEASHLAQMRIWAVPQFCQEAGSLRPNPAAFCVLQRLWVDRTRSCLLPAHHPLPVWSPRAQHTLLWALEWLAAFRPG